jgi:hypothetical protein
VDDCCDSVAGVVLSEVAEDSGDGGGIRDKA